MTFQLLSLDLFQTLVDLNEITSSLWQRILGRPCHSEELTQLSSLLQEGYRPYYRKAPFQPFFQSMASIFELGFQHVAERVNLPVSPRKATELFLEEHNNAPFFPDALELLRWANGRITVALSSDADESMVKPLLEKIPCQYVFLSQQLQCYKQDINGRFFQFLLNETGVPPDQVLHVGDGIPDVIGPRRSGIASCQISRKENLFAIPSENVYPDFKVSSLIQVLELFEK